MNKEKMRSQFLDYLEGKLNQRQVDKFEAVMAQDNDLKREMQSYKRLMQVEQKIAAREFALSAASSVKVMERIEEIGSLRSGRWSMWSQWSKRAIGIGAVVATACLALVIGTDMATVSLDMNSSEPRIADKLSDPVSGNTEITKDGVDLETGPTESDTFNRNDPYEDLVKAFQNDMGAVQEGETGSNKSLEGVKTDMDSTKERYAGIRKSKLGEVEPGASSQKEEAPERPDQDVVSLGFEKEVFLTDSQVISRKRQATNTDQKTVANIQSAPSEISSQPPAFASSTEPPLYPKAQPIQSASNSERYGTYQENPRVYVKTEPTSTFSIDVDTGSYTNVRRVLANGQMPTPDSVRAEEFVNYFSYKYPSEHEKPFGVYFEAAQNPFDKERYLLKIGVKARESKDKGTEPWNIVFLIDTSGSMDEPNKLPLLKESLKLLVGNMKPEDRLAIVTYAGDAGVALESTKGNEKAKILHVIEGLGAGGSTNGAGGIDMAYKMAGKNLIKGGVNRVVLATDGDFNVGVTDFGDLIKLIEAKRKEGVALTTLGFGGGNYKEETLEQLADKGNGNYFYIDSFREARKVLGEQLAGNMEIVAKDVKLQMQFNPAYISQYRLIGYDNRKLNREDFANDKIDAGEIGLGHTVTAIYEVVLKNSPLGSSLGEELRYKQEADSKVEAEQDHVGEFGFLQIRYKEPQDSTSKLLSYSLKENEVLTKEGAKPSDDFMFAASVVSFAQLLRNSQYAPTCTYSDIAKLAKEHKGNDTEGYRAEMIKLVEDAAALAKSPVPVE